MHDLYNKKSGMLRNHRGRLGRVNKEFNASRGTNDKEVAQHH